MDEPHEIRITSHGKIVNWVTFALDFFEKNPDKPLTLHTLPNEQKSKESSAADTDEQSEKQDKMPSASAVIPRLISVTEIIKREYVKKLDTSAAEQGTLYGLHQYNEVGCLEDSEPAEVAEDPETARLNAINQALRGKNHLKQKKTPFMRVTLCRRELASLKNATYQKPAIRKLSKSTRARLKRRSRKQAEGSEKATEETGKGETT